MYGRNVIGIQMFGVPLVEVWKVLHLERSAWSTAKGLNKQKRSTTPHPPDPSLILSHKRPPMQKAVSDQAMNTLVTPQQQFSIG